MANIGFIGLGIMGAPMALNLLRAGHKLFLYNRPNVPDHLIKAGGSKVESARKAAEVAEIIVIMVPDTPNVFEVLFGEDGVDEGLSPGKLVIDMSSISPIQTKDFAARIEKRGCAYLDAPVSGGEVGAKEATLSIMVGGPEDAVSRALPILKSLGKSITHVGENGAGQTTKVANQIVVALTIAAVSEALVLASKAGADPAKVRSALLGGFAGSRILEVHGERMINRQFKPGFRIGLHRKDLRLALDTASALGVSLPGTSMCQQLFNLCASHGWGEDDHSSLVRALELMGAHEISAAEPKNSV
jgi:2-hydroxy-3-oxopropionate reductase